MLGGSSHFSLSSCAQIRGSTCSSNAAWLLACSDPCWTFLEASRSSLIEAELAELGQNFLSLRHHNQQVFGPYYTESLKPLISPGQSARVEAL